jgi:cullin 3
VPPTSVCSAYRSKGSCRGCNCAPVAGERDEYWVNDDFSPESYRVQVHSLSLRQETEIEGEEKRDRVAEDRRFEIDAAIVRLMKTKKTMQHDSLMIELVARLCHRFLPSLEDMKKRILALIDRDILSRDSGDRNLYHYVP